MYSKDQIERAIKLPEPTLATMQRPAIGTEEKDAIPYALVPDGFQTKSLKPLLDEWLPKPERRSGQAVAHDLASFIGLTNRFKSEASALFCVGLVNGNNITAHIKSILNYSPVSSDNENADWGDHVVKYDFPIDKELSVWLEQNGDVMGQKDFALFLENHSVNLVKADEKNFIEGLFGQNPTPKFASPSEMIVLSKGLDVRAEESVSNHVNNNNGTGTIQFTTEHKNADGKALVVPEWFAIAVRVFEGGKHYQIPVRLRYRVREGTILWSFEMFRMAQIFDHAFNEECQQAKTETLLPLFKGTPEGK